MKNQTVSILGEIKKTNPGLYEALIDVGGQQPEFSLLREVKRQLDCGGFDGFIYEMMKRDILKGNFDVIYIDSRIVGENPKRAKAQRQLEKIRIKSNQMKNAGVSIEQIIMSM